MTIAASAITIFKSFINLLFQKDALKDVGIVGEEVLDNFYYKNIGALREALVEAGKVQVFLFKNRHPVQIL